MNLNIDDFTLDEIESIEEFGEQETIDITVEDTHLFYANGIYTHNSAVNKDRFDLSVISESLGKAQTADVIIGIGRTDEDKTKKRASLMILKNRNGEEGHVFNMVFDTSKIDIYVEKNTISNKMGIKGIYMEDQVKNNSVVVNEKKENTTE